MRIFELEELKELEESKELIFYVEIGMPLSTEFKLMMVSGEELESLLNLKLEA